MHAALGVILNSDGKPADHASIQNTAAGGNPGGFLGYATAWLEYELRGNATAARAFTGPHPELLTNANWPGSAVKSSIRWRPRRRGRVSRREPEIALNMPASANLKSAIAQWVLKLPRPA